MIRNRKFTWRAIAAILAAALVFTLIPASAFAVGLEPSGGSSASENARSKYADRLKEYAAQFKSGDSLKEGLNSRETANGAAGISDAKRAMIQKILGNKSAKESIRKKIVSSYSQGDGAATPGTGYSSRSIISLGALTVDEDITTLPYTDSKTIDKDTHRITFDFSAEDEADDLDGNTVLELSGYVYKTTFKKGAGYSLKLTSGAPQEFLPFPIFLDENGDPSAEMYDEDTMTPEETTVFVARKSGTHYIVIIDALEMIRIIMPLPLMPEFKGGTYTLALEKAYYLSGTVKDSKGKPVKNATVEVLKAKTKYVNDVHSRTWTDSKGKYKFFGLAPGKYKLRYFKNASSDAKPKYRLEYYNNRYSFKTAKSLEMPSGKNKAGVNMRLSAYKPPKADKKVKKLPFKVSSKLYSKPGEILTDADYVLPARVYSVKLSKGDTYEFVLKGEKLNMPVVDVTDSVGYYAGSFIPEKKDGGIAMGSFTPPKTDTYRIAVYDAADEYGYFGALSSAKGKFSLSVSKAFTPGRISGKATRAGGYPVDGAYVTVYKKYGKKWISYMLNCTDADGKYTVRGLKPGEYRVKFTNPSAKYYKKGKAVGVKKPSKASMVKVKAGKITRKIDIKF